MDQDQAVIREKLLRFYQSARQLFPIKKMLLYGSHAKGTATEDSDIDVAVVVDQTDHSKRIEITAKLFHAAFDIDAAIEPKCIFWDEYQNPDRASILSEIISSAIEIALIEQKKGFVMSEQYNTIKEIVFDMIRKTQGNVNYDELEKKVLSHFPDSAFKKSHWSWYRNQCSTGKYAGEFSKGEKENLSKSVHRKHKERISTGQKEESDELKTIEITKEVLRVVEQVIQSALEYERITGESRKLGITGEVGEILACYHLGLRLCVDPRAAGFDAIDFEGRKVQIKTRRSETDGLPKDAGRIGTFSKHTFDYALLVLLDREYCVAEIWRAEYDDALPLIEKQKRRNPNLSLFKKVSKRVWP